MDEWLKSCECLNSTEELEGFSRTLKVIAEPNRLKILCLLRRREMCVCEMVEALDLPQNLVSHHLRVLREEGLVRDRRDAQWVHYSIDRGCLGWFNARYLALMGTSDEVDARLMETTPVCAVE
jgi:ArsR family transcriptional regulator